MDRTVFASHGAFGLLILSKKLKRLIEDDRKVMITDLVLEGTKSYCEKHGFEIELNRINVDLTVGLIELINTQSLPKIEQDEFDRDFEEQSIIKVINFFRNKADNVNLIVGNEFF